MKKQLKIVVYHAKQCDPKKCSALKLKRHGLINLTHKIKHLPKRAVALNPLAQKAFSPADRARIQTFGLVAFDCSWRFLEKVLLKHVRGTSRCLPLLIAGNPVNFGKLTKLSTVEALAAALYITGFQESALELLSLFKWGHTFLEINTTFLEEYSTADDSSKIIEMQNLLFGEPGKSTPPLSGRVKD